MMIRVLVEDRMNVACKYVFVWLIRRYVERVRDSIIICLTDRTDELKKGGKSFFLHSLSLIVRRWLDADPTDCSQSSR